MTRLTQALFEVSTDGIYHIPHIGFTEQALSPAALLQPRAGLLETDHPHRKAYRMTLVLKNGLSFISFFAIEFEIGREGPLHLTELLERILFGPVAGHLEVAFTCNGNLVFVSLSEIESFDNQGGKTHSQTLAPFGNPHKRYTQTIVY